MYKKRDRNQQTVDDFILPFGGKLKAENRWVKMARMMPWDFIEDIYVESMSQENGAMALYQLAIIQQGILRIFLRPAASPYAQRSCLLRLAPAPCWT